MRNVLFYGSVIFLILCASMMQSAAQDLYVQTNGGSDSNSGSSWGSDNALATISQAVTLAGQNSEADVIHIAAGTYYENLILTDGLTLYGGYPRDGGTARDSAQNITAIDGSTAARVVTMLDADNVTIDGIVIQNGYADEGRGGGIYIQSCSNAVVCNSTITSNASSGDWGGGIAVVSSQVAIENNTISNNTTDTSGGGISFYSKCEGEVSLNTISGNSALYGGGVRIEDCTLTIDQNIISENSASEEGGAIYISHAEEDTTTIQNNTISLNTASYSGGGIEVVYCTALTIDQNTIDQNTAGNRAGGINYENSDCIISRNTITDNRSQGWSGGINCYGSAGSVVNNVIAKNHAVNCGGGLGFWDNATTRLTNNTIVENSAESSGGGVYCYAYGDDSSTATILNCIIRDNTPDELGGDGTIATSYSNITGALDQNNNLDIDPLFVGQGDYNLTADSPCIDQATLTGAPDTDIHGDSRSLDTAPDIGADEYLARTIAMSSFNLNLSSAAKTDTAITITATSANSGGGGNTYYRFDIVPGYGTGNYDPDNNWQALSNFSLSASVTHAFSQSGSYILITKASPSLDYPGGAVPIAGCSIEVTEDDETPAFPVVITGLSISPSRIVSPGNTLTITAQAFNSEGGDVYYRFDIVPEYGTDQYDPNTNWQMLQDFSPSNTCAYTFSEAGNYIVVVKANNTPALAGGAAPIIGMGVVVQ